MFPGFSFNPFADAPIINSLMDTDFYKFTMGQIAFLKYGQVRVTLKFTNRSKGVDLTRLIDIGRLREELNHCRTLRFNNSELHYLRGTNEYQERMFKEEYLQFLKELRLGDYELEYRDGEIWLTFTGTWPTVTFWEIHALSIINELYFRANLGKDKSAWERNIAAGVTKLYDKIAQLKEYPELTFSDFGTRRRAFFAWQQYVVETLARELPSQLLGTSNVKLAMDLGLMPMGTSAHERDMVLAALCKGDDTGIRNSIWQNVQEWIDQYGQGLSLVLPDTFGTDAFFREFGSVRAKFCIGMRQDSASPYKFGEDLIKYYQGYEIDSLGKLCLFSDGLIVPRMIDLHKTFHYRLKDTYGWGTDETNDLLVPPISIVVKVSEADGWPAVKLSDNLAKATGPTEEVERYKRIFGYTRNFSEQCRV